VSTHVRPRYQGSWYDLNAAQDEGEEEVTHKASSRHISVWPVRP
jgi:hypothetical protein